MIAVDRFRDTVGNLEALHYFLWCKASEFGAMVYSFSTISALRVGEINCRSGNCSGRTSTWLTSTFGSSWHRGMRLLGRHHCVKGNRWGFTKAIAIIISVLMRAIVVPADRPAINEAFAALQGL